MTKVADTAAASAAATAEADTVDWGFVHESKHPVVQAKISRMRRKDTDSKLFRELMYEIGTFMAYEATSDLSLTDTKPAQGMNGLFPNRELKDRVAIAPVLRSGLGLVDST